MEIIKNDIVDDSNNINKSILYYQGGEIMNFHFIKNGIINGLYKSFYSDGDIMYCHFYLQGQIEGETIDQLF